MYELLLRGSGRGTYSEDTSYFSASFVITALNSFREIRVFRGEIPPRCFIWCFNLTPSRTAEMRRRPVNYSNYSGSWVFHRVFHLPFHLVFHLGREMKRNRPTFRLFRMEQDHCVAKWNGTSRSARSFDFYLPVRYSFLSK